ncbi:MAG: DUF3997 domain-containing protein [Oligoflexus sp.]|nr:DUF3997 domain-containing protein [Pseudopedobacter sp.]
MKKFIFISTIVLLGMITSCSEHKYPDLGDGYKFETGDGNSLEIVNFENTVMVGTEILEYAFDSTFIVVSQRPWDVPDVPGIKEMTYDKRNEAFENSKFLQYWIINKKEESKYSLDSLSMLAKYSNVYGPFQKEEYLQKREELGVPRELILKE